MNLKIIALFLVFLIVNSGFVYSEEFFEGTGEALSTFEATDIIINVDSYHPTILSEQAFESDQPGGYPIFATLRGMKTNPLMDLEEIKNMQVRATGKSSEYIRGIYYKKPKSGYFDLNNLGYIVIRLKNLKEDDVPDKLDINMTADITLGVQNGFGVNEQDLTLPILDEEEFLNQKSEYGFYSGRGYVRLANIRGDRADFIVYDGQLNKQSVSVNQGSESGKKFIRGGTPYLLFADNEDFIGQNLRNTYKIRVNQIVGNKDIAKVEMFSNGDYSLKELVEGQYLYPGSQWKVENIRITDFYDEVELVNSETRDRKLLKGGKFYVPTKTEEEFVAQYRFAENVEYGDLILRYSGIYGVEPSLVAAVIEKESTFDSKIISPAGAVGLMQLMPLTAYSIGLSNIYAYDWIKQSEDLYKEESKKYFRDSNRNKYAEDLGNERSGKSDDELKKLDDRFDPEKNVDAGVKYLKEQLVEFNDKELALAAYNWGPGSVKNNCKDSSGNYVTFQNCKNVPSQTKGYVPGVLSKISKYEGMLKTVSEEQTEQILKDNQMKEADEVLKEKYDEIRPKLDLLIQDKKDDFEVEIKPVLELYKQFLVEVNDQDFLEIFTRYRGLIMNDLKELEDKYRSDMDVSDEISKYIMNNFNFKYKSAELEDKEKQKVKYVAGTKEFYFDKAIEYYRIAAEIRGAEYEDENVAMDAQLKIAKIYDYYLDSDAKAVEEYRKLISIFDYPEKAVIEKRIEFLEKISLGYESDGVNILERGNYITLNLYGAEKAKKDSKVTIKINEKADDYSIGGSYPHDLKGTSWYLKEVNVNNVLITKLDGDGKEVTPKRLRLDEVENIDGILFILEDVEMKQKVHITILPGEERLNTKSTFMLHIPVEPRLWDYTPEMIESHISFTERQINNLNQAIDVIEGVYKWWSLSCYGTFTFLWAKNIFWGGAKTARKTVMSAWKEECEVSVSKGEINSATGKKYGGVFDCIASKEDLINKDLRLVQDAYKKDYDERVVYLAEQDFENSRLEEKYDNEAFNVLVNKKIEDKEAELTKEYTANQKENKDEMEIIRRKATIKAYEDIENHKGDWEKYGFNSDHYSLVEVDDYGSQSSSNIETFNGDNLFEEGEKSYVFIGGKPFRIYKNNGKYYKDDQFSVEIKKGEGNVKTEPDAQKALTLISSGKWKGRIDRLSVNSVYYLEVPEKNGRGSDGEIIYVELWERNSEFGDETLSLDTASTSRIQGHFKLDDCISGSSSDRDKVDIFESLKMNYGGDRLLTSCKELRDMDRQVGLKDIEKGKYFNGYFVEYAIQETGGLQCFDIMSIEDCLTLFSVCDPVMCPASRFNAGGKWPVDNVVSTGIFGSIFLGSKLWRTTPIPEVGICVPGVDAGLKNYRSILQGYQECLIARRDTGENVGICDTIRNIGVCKILWREGTAFFRVSGGALDALLGVGKKATGGGEYGFFQTNMEKTGEFLNFFTKEYATTYFSAYRGASTDEIGEELCKAAIYGKVPGRGDLLDQLTKPEGPVQFTGWFTEIPHSDVGGELYSDYEVYYHIYAGEDREQVRYYVYLRDLDDMSRKLYITRTTGYLNIGDFVDETVRRTEITGYDELCIVIDNQEHCGFGRVSSDLLFDYLQDQKLEDVVKNENVKNERECIGDSSALNDPGVANIVDAFYPNIGRSGLIKVCSKENPGKGVDNTTWKDIGTCGNNSLGQSLGGCWVNQQSYLDALSEYDLERRKNAENFFKEFDLKSDAYVKAEILKLIAGRDSLVDRWKNQFGNFGSSGSLLTGNVVADNSDEEKTIEQMISEFEEINQKFRDLSVKTVNVDYLGKINLEIGETYHYLALLLDFKRIEEKAEEEAEKEKSAGVSKVDENGKEGGGCCTIYISEDFTIGGFSKGENYCQKSKEICDKEGFVWMEGGECDKDSKYCSLKEESKKTTEEKKCSDCGDDNHWYTLGLGNLCDKNECEVLGDCVFIEDGNLCLEVAGEITESERVYNYNLDNFVRYVPQDLFRLDDNYVFSIILKNDYVYSVEYYKGQMKYGHQLTLDQGLNYIDLNEDGKFDIKIEYASEEFIFTIYNENLEASSILEN